MLLGSILRLGRSGEGSNPSTETNFGDSSGLRVTLARLLSTRVRFPGSPPNDADIAQLAEAVGSNPTQCQFKSDYPYQMYLSGVTVTCRSPKPCVVGSNPTWDANFKKEGVI